MNFTETETCYEILKAIDQKGFYRAFVQGWASSTGDAEYERRRLAFFRALESLSSYIGYTTDLDILQAELEAAEKNRSTPYRDGSV